MKTLKSDLLLSGFSFIPWQKQSTSENLLKKNGNESSFFQTYSQPNHQMVKNVDFISSPDVESKSSSNMSNLMDISKKPLKKRLNNLFFNSNFNISMLTNDSNSLLSLLNNSLYPSSIQRDLDISNFSKVLNAKNTNFDLIKYFSNDDLNHLSTNSLLLNSKKLTYNHKFLNTFFSENFQFAKLIKNTTGRSIQNSEKLMARVSQSKNEIHPEKPPKIFLKSKKLRPITSNIPEINSIDGRTLFLQYLTFPFNISFFDKKIYKPAHHFSFESELPYKKISEKLLESNSIKNTSFISSLIKENYHGQNLTKRIKNSYENKNKSVIESNMSFKNKNESVLSLSNIVSLKNKQKINSKKLKKFLTDQLPKLSVSCQKPIVKRKKGKQKKQSISLKNYIKNLSCINNEYFQINQTYSIFNNKFILIQPIIMWTLISKALFFYFFLKYLKAFFLILGTEYITNLSKIFMNIKYSDGNLLSILQLYKEFNDQLNQQDTINLRVDNQINSLKH
nr:hypothetical protein [Trentepohlia sp. YN1242]